MFTLNSKSIQKDEKIRVKRTPELWKKTLPKCWYDKNHITVINLLPKKMTDQSFKATHGNTKTVILQTYASWLS